MDYITIENITHVHLKQFPDEIMQPYVDEANAHYEDIAMQKGIAIDRLHTPLSIVAVRYLANYVVLRFAQDSIGTNNVQVSDDDMYKRMYEDFNEIVYTLYKQLTPELMMGNAEGRTNRSVSTGRLFRTA
jgi:hypothetical protein